MLVVTTVAPDRNLLSLAELRAAIGVTDQDAQLQELGKRVSAAIAKACNVPRAGATPPTLRLETLTETLRLTCPIEELILSRRPVIEITSITEDTVPLASTDYEVETDTGLVRRYSSDWPTWWSAMKIVIVYRAGWETVPDDLKLAAEKFAKLLWADQGRSDPMLRSIEIPGVIAESYTTSPSDDPLMTQEIWELLADYINPAAA